jgi:hypothetical protein
VHYGMRCPLRTLSIQTTADCATADPPTTSSSESSTASRAHEVMAQVRDFLTNRLKLQMSVEKMTDRLPVPFGTTLIDDPDVCSAR